MSSLYQSVIENGMETHNITIEERKFDNIEYQN